MNLIQFKTLLDETIEALQTIAALYPNKVDDDCLTWLDTLRHPLNLEDTYNQFKNRAKK